MSSKKREEMSETELRELMAKDAHAIIDLLSELVDEALKTAPVKLIRYSDALMVVSGAVGALESRYMEFLREKQNASSPATGFNGNKKDFN